jgi:hypothetical protein
MKAKPPALASRPAFGLIALLGVLGVSRSGSAANEPDGVAAGNAAASAAALPLDTDPDDSAPARKRKLGLMFDLGSMDGGMLSLLYRPVPWLRLHGGAGTNAVSPGYRAGVTLASAGTGPSLNIEGGHFLPGDINGLLKILVGTGYQANERLENFDYDFVNLHLGWEIESGNLTFFARGGAGVLWTDLPVSARADAASAIPGTTSEPFWLVLPSVAFGFIGFL